MSTTPHSIVITPKLPGGGLGVSQELVGQGSGAGIFTLDFEPPVIEYEKEFADSPDTEGGILIRSRAQNPGGKWSGRIIGTDGASHWAFVQQLEQTIEACRGRFGGQMVWTPPDGTAVTFDIEHAEISGLPNLRDQSMWRSTPEVTFDFHPYGRLATVANWPLSDLDPFNRDTITNQEWRADAGAGTVAVASGTLTATTTANKRILRPLNVQDATAYVKVTTGPSLAGLTVGPILKRLDANNYLMGIIEGGTNYSVYKSDGGVLTRLGTAAATFSANTSYWIKFSVVGNVWSIAIYATDPNGSSPSAALGAGVGSSTLAGGDATKFGTGIKGSPGIWWTPNGTTEKLDDWRVDSGWMESFDPQLNFELLGITGSAPALLTAHFTDESSQARRHVEAALDDRDYDKTAPLPTLIDSDMLIPLGTNIGTTRAGAYDPGAAGNSVIRATLGNSQTAVCSTAGQLHTGPRKIKARVYGAGTGRIYVRLAYRMGDGAWFRKDWVQVPVVGNFAELDLGTITLPSAVTAGQFWEARIESYSETSGDTLDVDYLEVLPARRWGRAKVPSDLSVLSMLIQDRFNQGAAALTTQAVGGGAVQVVQNASGPNAADYGSNQPGTLVWSGNSINLTDTNYTFAQYPAGTNGQLWTRYLKATGFNFAIPATATIRGIQIAVNRRFDIDPIFNNMSNWLTFGCSQSDGPTFLTKDGSNAVGNNYAGLSDGGTYWSTNIIGSGSDRVDTYGGPNDLWGTTWTPAQINAATFGMLLSGTAYIVPNLAPPNPSTFYINQVIAIIYYTDSTGNTYAVVASSSANDFSTTGSAVTRTAVSDASINAGRYVTAGAGSYAEVGAAITVSKTDQVGAGGEAWRGGVAVRLTDISNYLLCAFDFDFSTSPFTQYVRVIKRKAGVNTTLGSYPVYGSLSAGRRLWIEVDARGNWFVWFGNASSPTLVMAGNDADLATGGTLATGKVALADAKTGATATTRTYDDLEIWTPDWPNPVVPAQGNLHIGSDAVWRDNGARPLFDGDYLTAEPALREGRGAQVVAKARRNDVDLLADDVITDVLRAAVDVTPRVVLL